MTANTSEQSLSEQVRGLREQLDDLVRHRSGAQPNKRDLTDCRPLTKIKDGQTDVYSKALGEWVPGEVGSGGPPPFPQSGGVFLATSNKWYPPTTLTVSRLFASLTTVGSTATTLRLLRNGAQVATLTLATGVATGGVALSQAYTGPETDFMQVEVTAAGTSAAGLNVQVS